MSSKSGEKRKAPQISDSDGGRPPVTTDGKRPKTNINTCTDDTPLLLETLPEILRKVYSFLSLKEALILRRTHRQFNEAANDLYQYSFIMC